MKNYKKVLCIALALVMVLAFAACGSKTDTAEEAGLDLSAGITRSDNAETGESTIENDIFSLTLPNGASWDYEAESADSVVIYNKAAREGDFGGTLLTIKAFEPDDESYDVVPNAVVGETGGKKIVAVFTSDVQYDFNDKAATDEYMEVFNVVQKISDDPATSALVLK